MVFKYLYEEEFDLAMEQLKIFATKNNDQYWILLFLERDPLIEPLKTHPEFHETMQKIKDRFWENHTQLKTSLENKGLI